MENEIVEQVADRLEKLATNLQPYAELTWEAALRQSYVEGYGSIGIMFFIGLVGGTCIWFLSRRIERINTPDKDGYRQRDTECPIEWTGIVCISICITVAVGMGVIYSLQLLNPEWAAICRVLHTR